MRLAARGIGQVYCLALARELAGMVVFLASTDSDFITGLPDALNKRDLKPRHWKPLSQFVFGGKWGDPSPLVR